jgi:hypothetical protein
MIRFEPKSIGCDDVFHPGNWVDLRNFESNPNTIWNVLTTDFMAGRS